MALLFLSSAQFCKAEEVPNTEQGFIDWLNEKFRNVKFTSEQEPIANFIKGKVIDQNGNPIPGVSVKASWYYTSALTLEGKVEEETVETDGNGIFFFNSSSSDTPTIREIKKNGYEFSYENNPHFNLTENEEEERLLRSDVDPVLFYLRKLGTTTYLYEYGYNWYVQKESEAISYDAITRRIREISSDLSKLRKPEFIDLVLSASHDTASGAYTVRLIAPLETNGMQVSDTKFYKAPAGGYAKELTLEFNHGDEVTKYIYFTSRNPAVYTRMELTCHANPERLTFRFDTWTNPYGSRNLELEPDLPWSLEGQLESEAINALKIGTIPPEPDIPALLATGKYE